ncbi:MAG: hypothetical protein ACI4AD_04900, partial [Roseburia sp.]
IYKEINSMNNNFKRYIVFWLSQALSQFGSSMTSFALILWAYMQEGTADMEYLSGKFHYWFYECFSRTCICGCNREGGAEREIGTGKRNEFFFRQSCCNSVSGICGLFICMGWSGTDFGN